MLYKAALPLKLGIKVSSTNANYLTFLNHKGIL